MNYYHYTKGSNLAKIVIEGRIRVSKSLIDKNEKPAVWLTKSPVWDNACTIERIVNAHELSSGQVYSSDEINSLSVNNEYIKQKIGMVRILIKESIPVISWTKFKYVSGISEFFYQAIDQHSRSIGSPVHDWLCSFSEIPKEYWEGIEMYVDDHWVRWDEKLPIQEFIDLCLCYNGKQLQKKNVDEDFSLTHSQCRLDFIDDHYEEIIRLWNDHKHKMGYIEVYVTPDYKSRSFEFIEKRFRRASFEPFGNSKTNSYALVHFLWEANTIQFRLALPYEEKNPKLNKVRRMKKNVKDFLRYLEMETDITVDLTTLSPSEKLVSSINRPIDVNVVNINEGTMGLAIFSCGCKNCKELTGMEIIYGENGSELSDAEIVKKQINTIVPAIPVEIRCVDEIVI